MEDKKEEFNEIIEDKKKDVRKEKIRTITSTLFLLLLMVAIGTMIFTVKTLIEQKDVIVSDPLIYGMNKHNFTSCSCQDGSGLVWESQGKGFTSTKIDTSITDRLDNFLKNQNNTNGTG